MSKTALITGAAKRIGKEIALHLAAEGWNIAIHYNKSEKEATELYKSLCIKYPEQEFDLFQADLQNPLAAERLVPEVCKVMPKLSLLINNASIFIQSSLLNSPFDLIEQTMQINYIAPMLLTRDFGRCVEHGNVINLNDTRITGNKADYAAYTLSKKGLWELTKMAALEFAPQIRVNSIALGTIIPPEGKGEDYLNKLAEKIPMNENASVSEVLKTLNFILASNHLTGQQIFCDGGRQLGKVYEYRD
ncbi:MAG: SDR family oxidoreductase [Mangrovibacterium sp.]